LESIIGRKHASIADRYIKTSAFHAPENVYDGRAYGTVPQQVLYQMLGQVNFRKHPKNNTKWAYTLSTAGQKGAVGKTADSKEEVCQLIWEEFRHDWSSCVSISKS